ncbi:AAA family ATPase [Aliikangiella sp. IMCC44359]|uniref:AAA family ATPase n=1 Tax=Aliikangiella sp. IMCC44359 TaxID=3459125 RepID=UPI00403B329E
MKTQKLNDWLDSLANDATPDLAECIEYLGDKIGWLTQLESVEQDPEWHAEGNVYIHTNMVLAELYVLLENEARHINGKKRQMLILGALLHDVGKTVRTKEVEINGVVRTVCPQHESIGRSYLAFKLMALALSFEVVWHILGLVGEHHMPKLLVVKNKNKGEYLSLSRRADLELLYWLEVADMRGRICADLTSQLTYLEEFKMFAEEYKVWNASHDLKNEFLNLFDNESNIECEREKEYIYAHALYEIEKNIISMPVEAFARTFNNRRDYANLIILCGPSGSGKSTWTKSYCQDFVLISLDEIRKEVNGNRTSQKKRGQILQLAKERLKACLRKKQDVVWDATNLRSDYRKILCDLGRDYHALVSMIVFVLPESDIFKGNKSRDFVVPEEILLKQFEGYQFPLTNEAHRVCFVGSKGQVFHRTGYWQHINLGLEVN